MSDPRVFFAAERTLLAWIRTGLTVMGFGFVVARFGLFMAELRSMEQLPVPRSSGWSLWIGIALLAMGVVVNAMAALQHAAFLRRLERGEAYRPAKWSLAIAIAAALAVLGVGTVVYLLLLVP